MAMTTIEKLRVKDHDTLLVLHAPADFVDHLGTLPRGAKVSAKSAKYQQVHWFVTNKAQLENELDAVVSRILPGVLCWIYYPKGSSQIPTDLTRDKGWEELLKHDELQWVSLISFDKTWSTFGCRLKTQADRKKESKPASRPIFEYLDVTTKTVRLPDDLSAAFQKNNAAFQLFNALSFTNRKEYVEWVISAKKPETRLQRIKGTMERLKKNWKNPRNL